MFFFVRQFLFMLVVTSLSLVSEANGQDEKEIDVVEIYAHTTWYREHSSPEEYWQGKLAKRDIQHGPGERTALAYKLVTDGDEVPIYSAKMEARLAEFVGRKVLVSGKLIDFGKEGFGIELWPGSIKMIESK